MANQAHEKFNRELVTFADKLRLTYPGHRPFENLCQMCNIAVSTNVLMPMQAFRAEAEQFRDAILSRDDAFFLQIAPKHQFLAQLGIHTIWPSASTETKDAVWKYVIKLYCLSTGQSMGRKGGGQGTVAPGSAGTGADMGGLGGIEHVLSGLPPGVMDGVQKLGEKISSNMQGGNGAGMECILTGQNAAGQKASEAEMAGAKNAFFDVLSGVMSDMGGVEGLASILGGGGGAPSS